MTALDAITPASSTALTLREFRDAFFPGVPLEWFEQVGVQEQSDGGITFAYYTRAGALHMLRERLYLVPQPDANGKKPAATKTPSGKKHNMYGEWCIDHWLQAPEESLCITEDEIATLTMWSLGFRALGIIGANGLNLDRDGSNLVGFKRIVIIRNHNASRVGDRPVLSLANSAFADVSYVALLPEGCNDLNDFYRLDPATAAERIAKLIGPDAVPVARWVDDDPGRFFIVTNWKTGSEKYVPKLMADELLEDHEFAVGEDGSLFRYADGVWKGDGDNYIEAEAARRLGARYEPEYVNKAVSIFKHTGSFDRLSFSPPVEERVYIHCKNGIVDVLEAAAQGVSYVPESSSPKRAWLACVPWDYDPTATCSGTLEFLTDVLPPDALDHFLELLGYGAQFRQSLRRLLLMHGRGHNGKSLVAKIMAALYGHENVTAMALASLIGNKFAAASLVGKYANICADIGPSLPKDVAVLKQMTGNDRMQGERKFRDPFTFVSAAFQVYSCNVYPRTPDTSDAFFGRFEIIPFLREFEEDEAEEARISALAENEDEMRGLLRLAVLGAARLAERGNFDAPPSCVTAKRQFIKSASPIRAWATECTSIDLTGSESGEAMWSSFNNYCTINGYKREREEGRSMFFEYLATLDGVSRVGDSFEGLRLNVVVI